MKLFFRVFLLTFYVALIFIKLDAQALGSYLFCVNKNNSWDWQWANSNKLQNILWAPADNEGFWIKGTVWVLNTSEFNEHSTLSVNLEGMPLHSNSNRVKRHAISEDSKIQTPFVLNSVCQTLVQTCVKEFGENYTYVGAAGHALARTDWGYIVADNQVCPNWNIPKGLVLHSESGYSLQGMIGQIAVDIVAGGPEEKINALDKISISSTKPFNNSHISISSNELPKKISNSTNEINNNLIQTQNNNVNHNLHTQTTEPPIITEIENSQSELGSSNDWITVTKRSGIPDRVKTRYNEIQDFYQRNKKYPAPRVFLNKEGLIKDSNGNILNGDLLEYDVPFPGQQGRDRKRIVIQKYTKNWWYTKDHYNSFVKMEIIP